MVVVFQVLSRPETRVVFADELPIVIGLFQTFSFASLFNRPRLTYRAFSRFVLETQHAVIATSPFVPCH